MLNTHRTILSVAELNAEVNQLLTQGFPLLWVEGEISNLVRPSSGHLYFTLKDSKSQIRSAMFRNRNMKLSIKPENGMKVLVRGRIGLYEPRGDYQLIAEHMEDSGIGQLQKQYEVLKQKLYTAGLFDESHKKELPEYPKRIGVITSPTGAAIRDILNVLNRRSPQTPVLIYPVAVQGNNAKTEIEAAIRRADLDLKCDVLILARGGGSIEDLWSFNEENVAKAIHHAKIPIVSGVGHEIDSTIADFVADLRAPTPSAAAELITPDREQLLTENIQIQLWLQQTMQRTISQKVQYVDWLESRLLLQKPSYKIDLQKQQLIESKRRITETLNRKLEQQTIRLNHVSTRLMTQRPLKKITEKNQYLALMDERLSQSLQLSMQHKQSQFALQLAKLNAISPLQTLERGYAIAKDAHDGSLISSVSQVKPNQAIAIKLKDGEINARVKTDK